MPKHPKKRIFREIEIRNSNFREITYVNSIAISGIKRIFRFGKQPLDIGHASNFELFGFLDDNLTMEGVDQGSRV